MIWVKAPPIADPVLAGKNKCCKEGTLRRWITEHKPQEVPENVYYMRKLYLGDLVRCDPPAPEKPMPMKVSSDDAVPAKKPEEDPITLGPKKATVRKRNNK